MIFRFLAAVGFAALSLNAAAITFSGTYSADVNTTDPGLQVAVSPSSGSLNFNLSAGQSTSWISLFQIYTTETWVNSDDVVPMTASILFNFTSPSVSSGTAQGSTFGVSLISGLWQNGMIRWDNGGLSSLLFSEGILDVFLKDTKFGGGVLGLSKDAGNVQAKFTFRDNAMLVPEPTLLVVFGAGLMVIALVRRRRGARVAE